MNTKKTAITIVLAIMAVAMITTVAMATNCFEPCGTKIEQCTNDAPTKDAVYALVIPGVTGATSANAAVPAMAFAFADGNGNGVFELGECAYVDTNAAVGPAWVEQGDIRLCGHCGNDPNTPVLVCDPLEMGNALVYPNNFGVQNIVGYYDINANGYYDIADPLYLDVSAVTVAPGAPSGISVVSVGDIRLSASAYGAAYSFVNASDLDTLFGGFQLFDPAPAVPGAQTPLVNDFNDFLGFVDTACDNEWDVKGADKLYLQQIVIGEPANAPLPLVQNTLYAFEGFVTIGDFRLYMPLNEPCWPDCGTKVEQCNGDAVYPLLIPGVDVPLTGVANPLMRLRWVDATPGGPFDPAFDDVYIETNPLSANPNRVEVGDVRLTSVCGCDPNTLVGQCSLCDVNAQYAPLVVADQLILGYVDANGNNRYDLDDPLYLDTSTLGVGAVGAGVVSINDIRLTARYSYDNYSIVAGGDDDLLGDRTLRDIATVGHPQIPSVDPINSYLGFVDSGCDGEWDPLGADKLYLQQVVFTLVGAPGAPAMNQLDRFASIGDFRLYMPIDEQCWPDCGTKVVECDVDAVYGLLLGAGHLPAPVPGGVINGAVPAMNIVRTSRGCYYVNVYNHPAGAPVGPGAVRLCDCCDTESNTVVKDCDDDANDPIILIPQTIVGYVDVNSNGLYDLGDPLYLDTGRTGVFDTNAVSDGDVRLTPRDVQGHHYKAYSIVDAADWDAGHGSGVGDILYSPKRGGAVLANTVPNVNWYLGFIDSNCDGMWDVNGEDELYLQQMVPAPAWIAFNEPQFNLFSTIGDDRLYMPPSTTPVCPQLEGDVNNDGNIDGADALLIARHIVGLTTLTGNDYDAADVNDDGNIDGADALLIARYIVGLITTFPGGVCIP